mgnify:CR=1 FL=1
MEYCKRIKDLFMSCLFKDGEPTDKAVMVEGITMNVGFNPDRLAESKEQIRAVAAEIVSDDFIRGKGGGMSFLRLCETRNGDQWGEHVNCQELMLLCIAAGVANYLLPRAAWDMLPGSVPYVEFVL